MKLSPSLLPLSIAANVALLAALAIAPPKNRLTHAPVSSPAFHNALSSSDANPLTHETSAATPRAINSRAADIWSRLDSEDLDQLVARLKASGFTYREIRAIVLAMADKKFGAARASLRGQQEDLPYWKPPSFVSENPEQRAKQIELMEQESAFYRKYFSGTEAIAEDQDAADYARQRYGNLPLEKLQHLARIQGDYDELQQKIFADLHKRARQELTDDDRKQLALLQNERERDIQQALTPEEFNEYLLRESPTAGRLRSQLGLLRPTEAEYKALFALHRPLDEKINPWSGDEKDRTAHAEALKNLSPQIQAALGPERYADYQQLMESGSDKVTRLMVRLDLPLATVGKINAVRTDITQRATVLRDDPQLSVSERSARLTALAQEAQTKLTTTLGGPRGYEAYTDMKGDWLRALNTP